MLNYTFTSKAIQRFWSKATITANPEKCWNWTAYKVKRGYGRIRLGDKSHLAHRVAYYLTYGEYPEDLLVCHSCDNPACINPNHLFLGTTLDNVTDKMQKGRHDPSRGEKNGLAKLTWDKVRMIRSQYATGQFTQKQLAQHYGIGKSVLSRVVRNEMWVEAS
jgi:hypothetical protein